jgi:hypothetical protein
MPPGWRQWAEVVHRDARAPKYLGDLPHTWVGSDYVRSVLDMFCYERARDSALVLAAGVPLAWTADGQGVRVRDLRTPYGRISYRLRALGDTLAVALEGGFRIPPGGIVVLPPAVRPFQAGDVNGAHARVTPEGGVVVRELPARVVLRP